MGLPLIATIHAARLEARFIKAMAEGRAWLAPPIRGWAAPTATPHITTRADIEEVDRLRADLKAAKGLAKSEQYKVLAQGKELHALQAAHMRLRGNLAKVQFDRDMLKALLQQVAPGVHNAWLLTQQITRNADIPQTHETHGD